MYTIEATKSIPTKFFTTIKTIKWSSWVVQARTEQIQNGGRPPYLKNETSPCIRYTPDCQEIWHGDTHWSPKPYRLLQFWTLDNPRRWTAAILKVGKSVYLGNDSTAICVVMHTDWSFEPDRPLKFRTLILTISQSYSTLLTLTLTINLLSVNPLVSLVALKRQKWNES